jgi:hypothetical protein
MNTNKQAKAVGALVGLAVMVAAVRAEVATPETVVQNFTITTPLTAAGPAALPTINQLWNIPQWAGLPSELQCVKLEVTNRLVYTGTISSLLVNQLFDLQVRSDFTLGLPGSVGSQTALDPVVLLSGQVTPGTALQPFPASGNDTQGGTFTLTSPADLAVYLGGGTVGATAAGFIVTDPLGGYHNISDQGPDAPGTFVNQPKVFPNFGQQLYQLETTLRVTYFVPEAEAPAAGLLGLAAAWCLRRRKRG